MMAGWKNTTTRSGKNTGSMLLVQAMAEWISLLYMHLLSRSKEKCPPHLMCMMLPRGALSHLFRNNHLQKEMPFSISPILHVEDGSEINPFLPPWVMHISI